MIISRKTRLAVISLGVILLVQVALVGNWPYSGHASDLTFSPVKNLSNDPSRADDTPVMAAAGNNVYVTWQNSTFTTNNDILFKASPDNGTTFGSTIDISKTLSSHNSRSNSGPQVIAATGAFVYVAWKDNTTGTDNIYFTASSNNGNSFVPATNLAAISPSSASKQSDYPEIAVSANNVYVAWYEQVGSGMNIGPDIFIAVSVNNGNSFTVQNLSNDKVATLPVIAAAGSNVYVAWHDTTSGANIFLRTSTNSGSTFTAIQNLSNLASGLSAALPQIVATGTNVYVVWIRDTLPVGDDVFFTNSTNGGSSFHPAVNLSQSAAGYNPALAAVGSNVYVLWADKAVNPYTTVKIRSSSNSGATFAGSVTLSNSTGFSQNPQVVAGGSNVYAAWQDQNSANNIFFRSSSDSGTSFGGTVNLSQDSNGQIVIPALATNGARVFVAWADDLGQLNPDILFRTNTAFRINFTLNALLSGWNSSTPPSNPGLTRFRGRPFTIQIIWKDSPTHQFALYTKGYPAGSVTPSDSCSQTTTNGCVAQSSPVTQSNPVTTFTFTPTIPTDFNQSIPSTQGPGVYEYYCKYHPTTMHGQITIDKNPDVMGDGKVDIVDAANLAFYFDLNYTSSGTKWNYGTPVPVKAVDLNNDGKISILDAAILAFYYDQTT